jgi:large subunit ribosomal protein L18
MVQLLKKTQRQRRRRRIRAKVTGTFERPRLSVFRSNKHLYVQLIDDVAQRTIVAASEKGIGLKRGQKPVEAAAAVGKALAERALSAGITRVVFDRGGFVYGGRVRAIAEGARKGGLKF